MNLRSTFLHLAGDLLNSVGVWPRRGSCAHRAARGGPRSSAFSSRDHRLERHPALQEAVDVLLEELRGTSWSARGRGAGEVPGRRCGARLHIWTITSGLVALELPHRGDHALARVPQKKTTIRFSPTPKQSSKTGLPSRTPPSSSRATSTGTRKSCIDRSHDVSSWSGPAAAGAVTRLRAKSCSSSARAISSRRRRARNSRWWLWVAPWRRDAGSPRRTHAMRHFCWSGPARGGEKGPEEATRRTHAFAQVGVEQRGPGRCTSSADWTRLHRRAAIVARHSPAPSPSAAPLAGPAEVAHRRRVRRGEAGHRGAEGATRATSGEFPRAAASRRSRARGRAALCPRARHRAGGRRPRPPSSRHDSDHARLLVPVMVALELDGGCARWQTCL